MPNGLAAQKLEEVFSIETWATVNSALGWSRIWDFGSNSPGGDEGELEGPGDDNGGTTEGLDYIFLSAERGTDTNVARVELRDEDPVGGGVTTIDTSGHGAEQAHLVVVYDSDAAPFTNSPQVSVYRDGQLIAEGTTSIALEDINDVNNWLGRSNWTNDANFDGSYEEFRIYDYALTNNQVLGNFEAGADSVNLAAEGDFNGDTQLNADDIDLLSEAVRTGDMSVVFDLNGDNVVNNDDRAKWVTETRHTWFGDSNLDGQFNSTDLVDVFVGGKYEDAFAGNSTWADGDWDGDGDFGSGDLVTAFTDGGYEQGERPDIAVVPEPVTVTLWLTAASCLALGRRRRRVAPSGR